MKAKRKAIAPVVFCFLILLTLVDIGSPPFLAAQDIVVESANPPAAEQGTVNLDVVIKGSGFGRGGAAKFFVSGTDDDLGGITVNSTTFKGPNRLIANITVADGATISKFDVQVQSNGRIGKGIELFAVIEKGTGAVDKGNSERRLVRADFRDAATDGIRSDGFVGLLVKPILCGLEHPDAGGLWDYWDPKDVLAMETCGDSGGVASNVSKGGRWFLFGHEQSAAENPPPPDPNRQRWLVFDFQDRVVVDGVLSPCPNLDFELYADVSGSFPPINPVLCIDNLEFRIRADRVFKKGAKRQQLDIEIVLTTGNSFNAEFRLEYVNPLFIVPHPVDPTAKILTTTGPSPAFEDVSEAELLRMEEGVNKAVPIGRFKMPFKVTVKRFCTSGGEPVDCR